MEGNLSSRSRILEPNYLINYCAIYLIVSLDDDQVDGGAGAHIVEDTGADGMPHHLFGVLLLED